jgi:hypothetical protein
MIIVHVRLNEHHTQQLIVAPWEVPVLEAVHAAGAVQISGESTVDKEPPDARSEYERLRNRYKSDKKTDTPYVAMVYGMHGAGIAALQAAIDKAAPRRKQAANG